MKIICPSCRYAGESKAIAKGSRKIEITLWCCLILPGMLYTMWRRSKDGQYQGCPQCHEANVRLMKRKEWKTYERNGELPSDLKD
jgi:ssDNA-binding Zn-finger/Zn-ribbon topoisomerase 1